MDALMVPVLSINELLCIRMHEIDIELSSNYQQYSTVVLTS